MICLRVGGSCIPVGQRIPDCSVAATGVAVAVPCSARAQPLDAPVPPARSWRRPAVPGTLGQQLWHGPERSVWRLSVLSTEQRSVALCIRPQLFGEETLCDILLFSPLCGPQGRYRPPVQWASILS